MRKAVGNMFSILPGGVEEILGEMLYCKARLCIAKSSVKEA
eukprot:CAMPEP_0172508446 /NCGR_PEP_ID=MMETSP1066-20121228/212021_1 /TAXON_ID=671091 /ORGANISM="Coscinodiscus wailesii, Strain CCMP2513" /LENGTH=40 /DNA_ID= /DNA_START= /DNA_END= /DNA_ORIENTATION=